MTAPGAAIRGGGIGGGAVVSEDGKGGGARGEIGGAIAGVGPLTGKCNIGVSLTGAAGTSGSGGSCIGVSFKGAAFNAWVGGLNEGS